MFSPLWVNYIYRGKKYKHMEIRKKYGNRKDRIIKGKTEAQGNKLLRNT